MKGARVAATRPWPGDGHKQWCITNVARDSAGCCAMKGARASAVLTLAVETPCPIPCKCSSRSGTGHAVAAEERLGGERPRLGSEETSSELVLRLPTPGLARGSVSRADTMALR